MLRINPIGRFPKRAILSFARAKRAHTRRLSALSIPSHELVDEEISPSYDPKHFYPAKPGEVLADQYQLLVKIGWGIQSTVWLARDITRHRWQSDRLMTLKIVNNCESTEIYRQVELERDIAQQQQISTHRGRGILRTCVEGFEVTGPHGNHVCLVYEPMREPLWLFQQQRFVARKLPLPVAKAYLLILLAGLDFLHSECRVVHTDLKLENILMTFENQNILSEFVKRQTKEQPMEYKIDSTTGRAVYRCHNDFGPLDWKDLGKIIPKIVDFGLATRVEKGENGQDKVCIHIIQPDHYRAPEVILGCGWECSADIWNFGALAWNIIERTELFRQVYDSQGRYDARAHIAEMIALLGPPPKKLLARSDSMARHQWLNPVPNDAGELCRNSREYFGGSFFDEEGNFKYKELIPARKIECEALEEQERESFLSFLKQMLTWLPEERKTAGQLMEHPFVNINQGER